MWSVDSKIAIWQLDRLVYSLWQAVLLWVQRPSNFDEENRTWWTNKGALDKPCEIDYTLSRIRFSEVRSQQIQLDRVVV